MNCDKNESSLRPVDYAVAVVKVSTATTSAATTTTTLRRIRVCLDLRRSFYGLANNKAHESGRNIEYERFFSASFRSRK